MSSEEDEDEQVETSIIEAALDQMLQDLRVEQLVVCGRPCPPLSLPDIMSFLESHAIGDEDKVQVLESVDTRMLRQALRTASGWRAIAGGWQFFDTAAGETMQVEDEIGTPTLTATVVERELFVLRLLHDADAIAKAGSVLDAVLPGARPDRPGRDESGVSLARHQRR